MEPIDGPLPLEPGFVIVRQEGKVLGAGSTEKKAPFQIPQPRGAVYRITQGAEKRIEKTTRCVL